MLTKLNMGYGKWCDLTTMMLAHRLADRVPSAAIAGHMWAWYHAGWQVQAAVDQAVKMHECPHAGNGLVVMRTWNAEQAQG